MNRPIISIIMLGIFIMFAAAAHANVKQLKTYREAYPDYKPNCVYCHIDEKPKKEEGQHELNLYGLKLQEIMSGQALTAEMVQSIGNHEDFKSEETSLTTDGTAAPVTTDGTAAPVTTEAEEK